MMEDERAHDELKAQVGRSAGHICFHEFRHEIYLTDTLAQAAHTMWHSLRSPWTLAEIWNNGTTIWQSPKGDRTATVTPDGDIQVAP